MESTMQSKITQAHLDRDAAIYVRQSTMLQVTKHTASTRLQYDLRGRAESFGWPREKIAIYDSDLGVSGAKPSGRKGFAQLVSDVGLGRIGIVLAFDATRLARNNTDWHRLLDMCGVCSTLVADLDGIYDVRQYNDRLLLGLKGTMSEAEHHLIRTRMLEGMEKKARSGELRKRLPVGLDYDIDGNVMLNPDVSIQHAIQLVFAKFRELGTAHQVYRHMQSEGLRLPVRRYKWNDVQWVTPRYEAVRDILANPRYAGAYVYGRTKTVHRIGSDAGLKDGRSVVPQSEWKVVLKDTHPGYVTWEQFEENLERLRKNTLVNSTTEASPVLRNGRGILHGILRCGVCGRRMYASYPSKGDGIRYVCQKKVGSTEGQGVCQSFGGTRIEDAVVEAVFDALSPASMRIGIAAVERIEAEGDAVLQQLEDQLQDAQYHAERARRQYDAVDPEHRNVARSLERNWNQRLDRVGELESRIDQRRRECPAPLSSEEKQRIRCLGIDLRRVWDASTTTHRDRKRILQTALDSVFASVDKVLRQARVSLVWAGGERTELNVKVTGIGHHTRVTDEEILAEVRRMASTMTEKQIAVALIRRGARTATGLPFSAERVRALCRLHSITPCKAPKESTRGTYTAQQAARELNVSIPTILRWIDEGFLPAERVSPYAPWQIRIPAEVRLATAERAPRGWVSVRKAAAVLEVTSRDVLQWIRTGRIQAMLSGVGRRKGVRVNIKGVRRAKDEPLFGDGNGASAPRK